MYISTPVETFFTLKGKKLVLIDWANIFHSQEKNGWEIDICLLYAFLSHHSHIHDCVLFHGIDANPKSQHFITRAREVGFRVVTKNVKYIPSEFDPKVVRRKCDFDVEIAKEILLSLDSYRGFMLFSGDGDYAPIFDVLRDKNKQGILVFPKGRLGREYNEDTQRRRGMFLCSLENIRNYIEPQ